MAHEDDTSRRYYVEVGGKRYGPADMETLQQWKAAGRIQPDTTLVDAESEQRLAASQVPGLYEEGTPTTPPPVMSAPPEAPYTPRRSGLPAWGIAAIVAGGLCVCGIPILAAILFPVFSQAKLAAKRTSGLSNLKQLAVATLMYAGDNDDRFPLDMRSAATFEAPLTPYTKSSTLFASVNPSGGEILGNVQLGGRSMNDVLKPYATGMMYDSLPWTGNKGIVAFVDGHAQSVPYADVQASLAHPLAPQPSKLETKPRGK